MSLRQWFGQPRSVLVLFLGTMLVLGGALAWLSWQLLVQERALERQRIQERLEQAADRVASELQRTFSELEALLAVDPAEPSSALPDNVAVLRIAEREMSIHPPGSILFQPVIPPETEPPPGIFEEGETLEHRRNDLAAAAAAYRARNLSTDPAVRAGALLRLGRVLRKAGRNDEALRAYDQLAGLVAVRIGDLPAELAAWEARCGFLAATGRIAELRVESERIRSALLDGRWALLRPPWEYYLEEVRRRTDERGLTEPQSYAVAVSRAVEWLYARWIGDRETRGYVALNLAERPILA